MHAIPALDLRRLTKLYDRTPALRAVTLRLDAGRTLALLGPNGSGKTTLLKIVAGAVSPTLGGGWVLGHDLGADRAALRREVGLLASESYLYDDLSALENLRFVMTMAGYRPREEQLVQMLDKVALAPHAHQRLRTFSSGMKKRLSLARVLLLDPRLLLLDEPYNSLDLAGMDLIDEIVREGARHGRTTVLATHDAERALALADESAVLEQGRLVALHPAPDVTHAQYVG